MYIMYIHILYVVPAKIVHQMIINHNHVKKIGTAVYGQLFYYPTTLFSLFIRFI